MKKLLTSCHNHTKFCDGACTPAELAAGAYALGFTDFGFSEHVSVALDPTCGMTDEAGYVMACRAVQKEYAGKMRIAVGVEHDILGQIENRDALDYIIGSVHSIYDEQNPKRCFAVDGSVKELAACRDEMFEGDMHGAVAAYYTLLVKNTLTMRPDVVGHFDLIAKNNEGGVFFDESDPGYQKLALDALDACMQTNPIFEVNTGGMYRGYRTAPYPARYVLNAMCQKGARVMINADAHCIAALDFKFDETLALLREVGFERLWVLEDGKFAPKALADV